MGMLSFHFVKIDFRKIFASQKMFLGSGFCVLPFLGLAKTMHAETHFECGRREWNFS